MAQKSPKTAPTTPDDRLKVTDAEGDEFVIELETANRRRVR